MATDDKKYSMNPFAAALMAGGDAISGIYGQRGNTYSAYLESQNKRMALESEAIKAQQALAQQQFENQLKTETLGSTNAYRQASLLNQERGVMNQSGFIPAPKDQLLAMTPQARMDALKQRQVGDITGKSYIPKPDTQQQVIDPGVVDRIATYNTDIKTIPGFGMASVRNAYLKAVVAQNPQYDQKQYVAASKFMTGLADTRRGTPGGIVNSANTLLGHLDYLDKTIDELKNSKLPTKNLLVNFAKYQLGNPNVTNLQQAKEVVNSELETLLTGIGVTQEGLKARRTLLNENTGYEQQKEAIKTLVKIMKSRIDPIEKQYKTYGGTDSERILAPESKAIMSKYGVTDIPKFDSNKEARYQAWKKSQGK